MSKFKVGQQVRVVDTGDVENHEWEYVAHLVGQVGTVVFDHDAFNVPVGFDGEADDDYEEFFFYENELEAVE